jgi:hypothetical protein
MTEEKQIPSEYADFETSKMLKDLFFNEQCQWVYDLAKMPEFMGHNDIDCKNTFYPNSEVCTRPTWFQIEYFLWNTHKIFIHVRQKTKEDFICTIYEDEAFLVESLFHCPVTARIDGLALAVDYLIRKKINEEKKRVQK